MLMDSFLYHDVSNVPCVHHSSRKCSNAKEEPKLDGGDALQFQLVNRHHCSGTGGTGNSPASPLGKHSKGRATLSKVQSCWLTTWWLTNFFDFC